MNLKHALILAAALPLAACGGDDDEGSGITGVYEVTSHTLSTGGCNDLQAVTEGTNCFICMIDPGRSFLAVVRDSFFGISAIAIEGCDTADECPEQRDEEEFGDGTTFPEREGDNYVLNASGSSGGGSTCSFTVSKSVLSVTENGLMIRRQDDTASDLPVPSGGDCGEYLDNPPSADMLTCDRVEIIEATAME